MACLPKFELPALVARVVPELDLVVAEHDDERLEHVTVGAAEHLLHAGDQTLVADDVQEVVGASLGDTCGGSQIGFQGGCCVVVADGFQDLEQLSLAVRDVLDCGELLGLNRDAFDVQLSALLREEDCLGVGVVLVCREEDLTVSEPLLERLATREVHPVAQTECASQEPGPAVDALVPVLLEEAGPDELDLADIS